MSLIANWWTEILAGLAFIAAILSAYFGGKKIGTTQTQAKADVTAAKVESAQVAAVAEKQKENVQAVKSVQQAQNSMSDDAARSQMSSSKYNQND